MCDCGQNGRGFACNHVLEGARPVQFIVRYPDSDFSFLCGEEDHDEDSYRLVCPDCAIARNNLPFHLRHLPVAHEAEYISARKSWKVTPTPPEDIEEFGR